MSDELTYTVDIQGVQSLLNKLNSSTQSDVIRRSLKLSGLFLAAWSKTNRLSGPRPEYLGVVTGRLRASITAGEPTQSGNNYIEKIGTNVEYARIHEFGGRVGKYGGGIMPARPFLSPSIGNADNRAKILDIFTQSINEALAKQ